MKLIPRRKQEPTTLEKALSIISKVIQALAAVRVARGAWRGYLWARRLPLLLAGTAIIAFVARRIRGRSGSTPAAPPPAPSSSVPTPPPAPATPGGTDDKSRAEAAVATSAGLADAEATTGGESGATDEDAGTGKSA
jgi:hypothetical protein